MKQKLGPVYVLIAGTLWGFMGMFVRHFQSVGLGSIEIAWFRVFFGMVIVGAYLALFHRELLKVRFRDLWCFVGTGIGSLFLLNLTYYSAMEHVSLAVAGVLLYTSPAFVMILGALLFREKITLKKVLALALAFLGCALVSGIGTDNQISTIGLLWGLGSGLSYAMYSVFGRYAIRRGYGSWTMTFYTFLFCFLANCLICDWHLVASVFVQPVDLGWAVGLGVVTAFLPYIFYSLGLESMDGTRVAIVASIEPVVATLLSVFVYREPLGVTGAVGIGLVLAAIVLLSLNSKAKTKG